MKRNYFILFLSIFCYVSFAQKKMVVFKSDGTSMRVDVAKIDSIIFEDVFDESHAVDLGLSVKWCDVNLGAKSSEQYGDYFAWGETTTKASYEIGTYKFCQGDFKSLTKYNNFDSYGVVDGLTRLDSIDDAAHVQLQEKWRIPTKEEFEELVNNCNWEWTVKNGIDGYLVTGPNGNSIFIPVAGYLTYDWDNAVGKLGHYWSSSLSTNNDPNMAYFLAMDKNRAWMSQGDRYIGRSIRPVYDEPIVTKRQPMAFGIEKKSGSTRATEVSASYDYLGNTFNVYGCNSQDCVINNYCVWYDGKQNEASCNGWNYVGEVGEFFDNPASYPIRQSSLKRNQPISYWNNDDSKYMFYAYSAPENKANLVIYGVDYDGYAASAMTFNNVTDDDNVFCCSSPVSRYDKKSTTGYSNMNSGSEENLILFNLSPVNGYVRFGFYETVPGYSVRDIQFAEVEYDTFTDNFSNDLTILGSFISNTDACIRYGLGSSTLEFNNPTVVNSKTFKNEPLGNLGTSLGDVTYIRPIQGYGPDGTYFPILPRKGYASGLKMKLRYSLYAEDTGETIQHTLSMSFPEAPVFQSGSATTFIIMIGIDSIRVSTAVESISFTSQPTITL